MKVVIFFAFIAVAQALPNTENLKKNRPVLTIPENILHQVQPADSPPDGDTLVEYINVKEISAPQDLRGGPEQNYQEEASYNSAGNINLSQDILSAIELASDIRYDVLRGMTFGDYILKNGDQENLIYQIGSLEDKASPNSEYIPNIKINDPNDA